MTFEVTILGSTSATFAYGRHQTSQLLNHNDCLYLIDCGEGTQLQMQRYRVRIARIERIFISHLHGDHFLGLVGLMLTMQLQSRKSPLHVYGPPGLDEIIATHMRLSDTRLTYDAHFHPIPEGPARLVFDGDHVQVFSIPLQHRIVCNGFLFVEKPHRRRMLPEMIERFGLHPGLIAQLRKGNDVLLADGTKLLAELATLPPPPVRKYAFCSDTMYIPELAEQLHGVDLLYHESTFLHELLDRALITHHTTALQAAQFAELAQAGKLLLGHFSSRYKDLSPLLAEARTVFADAYLAEEGLTFSIGAPTTAPVEEMHS